MERKIIYEFGPFRLDPGERQLQRDGEPISLRPQVFDLLLAFVEDGGHLLTKEELKKKVWAEQFVPEDNLKVTVGELRRALSNRQSGDVYIETVSRKGYRFLPKVEKIELADPEETKSKAQAVQPKALIRQGWFRDRRGYVIAAVSFVILVVLGASARLLSHHRLPSAVNFGEPLTHNKMGKGGPLFTDGTHIYFNEVISGKAAIACVSVSGGEVIHIPAPFPNPVLVGIFPDNSGLLAKEYASDGSKETIWKLPLPGGSPQPMENLHGRQFIWSRDGQSLAYTDVPQHELWVAREDGSAARKILSFAKDAIGFPTWSPDGKFIRFTRSDEISATLTLWQVRADGADLSPLLPVGWNGESQESSGVSSPTSDYFVFASIREHRQFDLWALAEQTGWFSNWQTPVRLTQGPLQFGSPLASPDGKKIFALGTSDYVRLERYSSAPSPISAPYLGGISAVSLDFSRDGQWVAYNKYPEETLWRSKIDGSEPRQLTFAPLVAGSPHWSPDGKWIAYRQNLPGRPPKIHLISRDGGVPQQLLPESPHQEEEGVPTWSPDGNSLVFGELRWWPERIAIHIFDLRTRDLKTVPGSTGLWTPRWSPSGRYLLALTADPKDANSKGIWIFDLQTQKWRRLLKHRVMEPYWSRDEKYIFFDSRMCLESCGIFRVRVSDGKVEKVLDIESYQSWSLAPDDSLLVSKHDNYSEIYALDVQR